MATKPKDLAVIAEALSQMSFAWISDNHPTLADALAVAVERGATPREIRTFVMHLTERRELALRCEQAARWLAEAQD